MFLSLWKLNAQLKAAGQDKYNRVAASMADN